MGVTLRCTTSGEGRTAPGGNQEGAAKMGASDKGASGISRLLGAAKLQSAPGADNPRYAIA